MPEVLEIELYRRAILPVVGRTIRAVDAPDAWYLKRGLTATELEHELPGERISAARRRGKLLLLDLSGGHVLGLRFGMTGRPLLDESAAPFDLEYSTRRSDPNWIRFGLDFDGGGRLAIEDPRRLGGVELDPPEEAIGPDAFGISRDELDRALESRSAVKAVLLDQARIGGLGNMLADELLFRVGIDPARPAVSLSAAERDALHDALGPMLGELLERGGSHAGNLAVDLRMRGARCPIDGAEFSRRTIGGRTTYSCPLHQR
ncbi:MAG: DNA-formamidopyrimidine glycosylase family protein [Ilumatobacteraceae bacterium]